MPLLNWSFHFKLNSQPFVFNSPELRLGTEAPRTAGSFVPLIKMSVVRRVYQSNVASKRPFNTVKSTPKSNVLAVSHVKSFAMIAVGLIPIS